MRPHDMHDGEKNKPQGLSLGEWLLMDLAVGVVIAICYGIFR